MSWYTTGPGGLRSKFGDVSAVARSSGLGRLYVVPRVTPVDPDGEPIETDDLEFLGHLQPAIVASGERMAVPLDVDRRQFLRDLSAVVAEHAPSILTTLAAAADDPPEVAQLHVSIDSEWNLDPTDVAALVEWLNSPFGPSAPLSVAGLGAGSIDGGRYQPPPALVAAFDRLAAEDPTRYLAARAVAAAVVTGEDVWLLQPDDDHTALAWDGQLDGNRDRGGAILVRPTEHPFLELLAQVFDVPAAVREQVFYLSGVDVDLPPGDEATEEEERAGLAFASYLATIVSIWAADRLLPGDGDDDLGYGFHVGGTLAALTDTFARAGVPVHPLDLVLAGEREPFEHLAERARLATMRDTASDGAVYGYILDGGPVPPTPDDSAVACLLVLLEQVDLSGPERQRLADVLRAAHSAM